MNTEFIKKRREISTKQCTDNNETQNKISTQTEKRGKNCTANSQDQIHLPFLR